MIIINYDDELKRKFNELNEVLKSEDDNRLRELIRNDFQMYLDLGRTMQHRYEVDGAKMFEGLSDEDKNELLRPLSRRQVYELEAIYMANERRDALWAYWDFLHDYDKINQKRFMSVAEITALAMMTERMLVLVSNEGQQQ